MIEASCHCGAVRIEIPEAPERLTECNCSMCRRLATRWAYYTRGQITIHKAPDATVAYAQGDRTLATHHCRVCGCTTHWEGIGPEYSERVAVNARLFEPADLEGIRVRRFDGADTWEFLD
ncbi:MAG TPA: GFA family protein [Aliidongia sp.]|uniref:GFA family protein n=1 Tax=Aliidongia sp. TaxID=1914230 RepID=UPI002DDDABA6|nr:GFA family protein [Aliidongia sp.]HEV2673919.1 GFA family protein [Aliidongia sp.]